jgi:hypothetical protein
MNRTLLSLGLGSNLISDAGASKIAEVHYTYTSKLQNYKQTKNFKITKKKNFIIKKKLQNYRVRATP